MNQINLNQNQFSDLLNLLNNVFYPLKNFANKKEFLEIIYKKQINKFFFPFPIYFGVNKKLYIKIKNKKKLKFFYKKKMISEIKNINFFTINKTLFGKRIFGKNFKKHPYFKKFVRENYKFLSFKITNLKNDNLKNKFFISPKLFIKKYKIKKNQLLAGFHTRNVPHKAHQWIHNFLLRKCNALLIQPLLGQYNRGEYKDNIIIFTNKIIIKKYVSKNIFVIPFFSYPRYGGVREAALHAIVRRNYGCTHFWVGRDHAGYKNFYKKYESQIFCKKNQKRLKINIISEKEPYYCLRCKKIVNSKCKSKKCSKIYIERISGTKIRKFLKDGKNIPEYLIDKKISKFLSKKSLIV